jgi:hypothetical protein
MSSTSTAPATSVPATPTSTDAPAPATTAPAVPDVSEIQDFDQLLDMVRLNADLVDHLTDDQVLELRKKMNPYGRTIEGSDKLTCLSITNLSKKYMQRFLMTSLVGFLYRQCDEHELDSGEPPAHMDDFTEYLGKYNQANDDALIALSLLEKFKTENPLLVEADFSDEQKAQHLKWNRIVARGQGFKKRLVIRQFLDSLFQFNPDMHVRSAYSSNPLDPERVKPAQVKEVVLADNEVKADAPVVKRVKTIVGRNGEKMVVTLPALEEKARSESPSVRHIPPSDTFHRWTYYTDSCYEEIRTAVQDIYCEKPDMEFAINPYDQFTSEEGAKKFVQKHKNEVITDIVTLTNGSWNLMGSFKKNRDRINFYNDKTVIVEQILNQVEDDKRLGAQLMRKRVAKAKDKNIAEAGPDPEALKEYKRDFPSAFAAMGAEDVRQDEKENGKPKKETFTVSDECPYNAVQVDMFDFNKGGVTVKKSEFYTEAEAPEPISVGQEGPPAEAI